ncbi:PD-(D/E)XK nuclease domain-containing protein, partial [Desulfobulbus sp. N2]|nr:PD-(D/E)XK nuclease domain-containing protein [Desulfobulbus sp. N2]
WVGCEIQSNFGSTDVVIKNDGYIYVMEFKMGKAQTALEQIKKRKYHAPYLADKREVVLVGFGFDKAERNLIDYSIEAAEVP